MSIPINKFFSKKVLDLSPNNELLVASCVYIAGSFVDYYATAYGMSEGIVAEKNYILNKGIEMFGPHLGILLPKGCLASLVLGSCTYLHKKNLEKKTSFKPEYLLYPAAIATAMTGYSWMIHQYVDKLLN